MKIVHIIQKPQLRGAEVFACQLATEMMTQGHESVIVTLFRGSELPFTGKVIKLDRPVSKRWFDLRGMRMLSAIIAGERPDLVQANAGDTLRYAVLSRILFRWRVPVVFRNASMVSLYLRGAMSRRLTRFLLRHSDHIVSVSRQTKADLVGLFPFVSGKIDVVPVGVVTNGHSFEPVTRNGTTVFLHVGGFSFEKNHKALIRIFERLSDAFPDSELWLVGDGPLKNEIETLVKVRGLATRVRFFGYQRDPGQHMNSADLFLLPSIIEGLPSVILEAFWHRLPVVAYNTGGIAEIVEDGVTGALVPTADEGLFVQKATNAILDSAWRRRVTPNARALVTEHYSMRAISMAFLKIYQHVTSKERSEK